MSRPSRFMRSMTPSGSVKMSASRFNVVCGRTREMACRPNVERVPNPRPPKVIDAKVTTPTLSRREMPSTRRESSMTREAVRAPLPPARESSHHLPFGSYADMGCHTKAPTRYSMTSGYSNYSTYPDRMERSRRSKTPLSVSSYQYSTTPNFGSSNMGSLRAESRSRRASATFTQQSFQSSSQSQTTSRQRHSSCSFGTPAAARGIPFF